MSTPLMAKDNMSTEKGKATTHKKALLNKPAPKKHQQKQRGLKSEPWKMILLMILLIEGHRKRNI